MFGADGRIELGCAAKKRGGPLPAATRTFVGRVSRRCALSIQSTPTVRGVSWIDRRSDPFGLTPDARRTVWRTLRAFPTSSAVSTYFGGTAQQAT